MWLEAYRVLNVVMAFGAFIVAWRGWSAANRVNRFSRSENTMAFVLYLLLLLCCIVTLEGLLREQDYRYTMPGFTLAYALVFVSGWKRRQGH